MLLIIRISLLLCHRPVIHHTVSLEDACDTLQNQLSRHAVGKIVVRMWMKRCNSWNYKYKAFLVLPVPTTETPSPGEQEWNFSRVRSFCSLITNVYLPTFSESKAWEFYPGRPEVPRFSEDDPSISEDLRRFPKKFRRIRKRKQRYTFCRPSPSGFATHNHRSGVSPSKSRKSGWKCRHFHGFFYSRIGSSLHIFQTCVR